MEKNASFICLFQLSSFKLQAPSPIKTYRHHISPERMK